MFKKKEYLPINEYGESWIIKSGISQGLPIFVRYNEYLKEAIGHRAYPYQLGIAVPLNDPNDQGLPSDSEAKVLFKIEDNIAKSLQDEAQLVMTITTNGMREFVLYAQNWTPEAYEELVKAIGIKFPTHELQFMIQKDTKWSTFKTYTSS